MKKTVITLLSICFALLTLSCATSLTKEGQSVKLIMKQEAPDTCELLGDLSSGMMGEPDTIGVKNKLRNKTAEMGGDLVVVDTMEVITDSRTGTTTVYYKGAGRAYKCK